MECKSVVVFLCAMRDSYNVTGFVGYFVNWKSYVTVSHPVSGVSCNSYLKVWTGHTSGY